MQRKKPKTKRQLSKYSALDKAYNLKTRTELNDFDYINGYHDTETGMTTRPLNDDEKEWLNKFQAEYVNTEFSDKTTRVHKKIKKEHPKNSNLRKLNKLILEYVRLINIEIAKAEVGYNTQLNVKKTVTRFKKNLKNKINKEFKFIKDFYKNDAENRNNARNRCILTKAKAQGKVLGITDIDNDELFIVEENIEDQLINNLDFTKKLQNTNNK